MTRTIQLSLELKSPTRLNRSNLHPYRLKVKELRNLLQLSDQAGDPKFLEKLGEVKDTSGSMYQRALSLTNHLRRLSLFIQEKKSANRTAANSAKCAKLAAAPH